MQRRAATGGALSVKPRKLPSSAGRRSARANGYGRREPRETLLLERFQAKWIAVRVKKTRQNNR
jgi:hypothetical protein